MKPVICPKCKKPFEETIEGLTHFEDGTKIWLPWLVHNIEKNSCTFRLLPSDRAKELQEKHGRALFVDWTGQATYCKEWGYEPSMRRFS